jgi:hypothetical protein
MRSVAALAVVIAALGGPVAQFLRIEETRSAGKDAPSQFRIVLAEDWPQPAAVKQQPANKSKQPSPPRILRPLADHWEAAARVQFASADIPTPVEPLGLVEAGLPPPQDTTSSVCLTYRSSSPLARGPPA